MKRRYIAKGSFSLRRAYSRIKIRHKRRKVSKSRVSGQDIFGHGK